MYRVSRISLTAAGLCLMLGASPGFAGPPNNDVSDSLGNTAGGTGALKSNTTSPANTAFGLDALQNNTTGGGDNSAFGFSALRFNTTGVANTAVGEGALQTNTTGGGNTSVGYQALFSNTTGGVNTAVGEAALGSNTTGSGNDAVGEGALSANTTGTLNTALGNVALEANTTGGSNTAVGYAALYLNTTSDNNAAFGVAALESNTTGGENTALGAGALFGSTTGNNNIAIGFDAGLNLTSGSNNIYLGASPSANESSTMRIGQGQTRTFISGISGVAVTGAAVEVTSTGQLGIMPSAARFKHDIRDLAEGSSGLLKLRPVSFRYNNDPADTLQYGLVAEEVAKIYPELVTYDADGQVLTVRYQVLSAMLLNELQKQAKESEAQRAAFEERVAKLERTIEVHNGN